MGDAVGDDQACQPLARVEYVIANVGQGIGQADAGEHRRARKQSVCQSLGAVANDDVRGLFVIIHRPRIDVSNATLNI